MQQPQQKKKQTLQLMMHRDIYLINNYAYIIGDMTLLIYWLQSFEKESFQKKSHTLLDVSHMPSNKSTNLCLSHQSSTIPRIKQDDKNQRGSQVETL